MKLSILTPVYNGEKYIRNTIESVLNQKGDYELEYIILDGKSDDRTVDIIKEYYERYLHGDYCDNFKNLDFDFFSQKDTGMYEALANGFRKCHGDIIAWINADDFYLDGSFGKVINIFSTLYDIKWIVGRCNVIDEWGNYTYKSKKRIFPQKLILNGAFGLYSEYFIPQESTFWRRELLNYIDLNQLIKYRLAGDFYLWTCFAKKEELFSVNEDFAVFRKTKVNMSRDEKTYRYEMKKILSTPNYVMGDEWLLRCYMNTCDMGTCYPIISSVNNCYQVVNKQREKGEKKLSIITILYDLKDVEYICESIINQTWTKFEWIVLDATENAEIVEKLREYIDIYIRTQNKKLDFLMKFGIEVANCEWLIFLNENKFYNFKVLEKVFSSNLNGVEIIYGNTDVGVALGSVFYKKILFKEERTFCICDNWFSFCKEIKSIHIEEIISISTELCSKKFLNSKRIESLPSHQIDKTFQIEKSSLIKIKNYQDGKIKKYYLFGTILIFVAKRAY
ncbi:MAG: glycosyltransferase [Lachnospiraceae bacterium]|nr:glycosyltransferase [Lachnospiraceae bacterium]